MAGLFDGLVQENPIFVDNSEKYAKRSELARDQAVKAEAGAMASETSAKNEAISAKTSADYAASVGEIVSTSYADIKKVQVEVKESKDLVVDYRNEVLATKVQFTKDVEQVSKDKATVTSLKGDIIKLKEEAVVAANNSKLSADEAKVYEDRAKFHAEDARMSLSGTEALAEEVEVYHEAVVGMKVDVEKFVLQAKGYAADSSSSSREANTQADRAKDEAAKAAASTTKAEEAVANSTTQAGLSKKSAEASEASSKGSQEWYDKSYDLYTDLKSGQVYRGVWNPSTGAYPDHQGTNSVWDVIVQSVALGIDFDGKTWRSGDRLIYVMAENKYDQLTSGSTVTSINGKSGSVTLEAADVHALSVTGDTMKGHLELEAGKAQLVLNTNYVKGFKDSVVLRDHGNGNVTLSAGVNASGEAGTLYLGYTGSVSGQTGYNTKDVRLDAPMSWRGTTSLITGEGKLNSEAMVGPIRTERDSTGVWHTMVGGTDTVNRGRTIVAGGECGKQIADNIPTSAEQVHIGGDDTNGVLFHTGLQNGWDGSTHYRYWLNQGNLYSQKRPNGATVRFYNQEFKPTPSELGVINKTGDTGIGDLTLNRGKVLDATLVHRSGYMSINPYNSSYGGELTGNRCRVYYKEHENGKPESIKRGLVFNSTDADGKNHDMDIWLNSQRVFHEGFKPTAADVGALSTAGGTVNGQVILANGDYRHRLVQSGTVTFFQGGHVSSEIDHAIAISGYNGKPLKTFRTYMQDGVSPLIRWGAVDHKVYHEGNKPTLDVLRGNLTATKATTETIDMGPFTIKRNGNKLQFLI